MSLLHNHATLPATDPAPPSREERLLSETALGRVYDLRRQRDKEFAESDAFQAAQNELRAELALLQREHREMTDGRLPTINTKLVAALEKKIDKLKARIAANIEKREADQKQRGSCPLSIVEEWLSRQSTPRRDRGTTDELRDGMTKIDMLNHYGNKIVRLGHGVSAAETAQYTRGEIIHCVTRDVGVMVRRVNTDRTKYPQATLSGKRRQGRVEWPMVRIGGQDYPDAFAIMLNAPSFRKELTDTLIAQALAAHDEKHAMTPGQRDEAVAKAKAELLDAEYKAAFWWRTLADDGHQVAPKTTRPECLLDVE